MALAWQSFSAQLTFFSFGATNALRIAHMFERLRFSRRIG
jgi:hypothetical protein